MTLQDFAAQVEGEVGESSAKFSLDLFYAEDLARYLSAPQELITEWGLDPEVWYVVKAKVKAAGASRLEVELAKYPLTAASPAWEEAAPRVTLPERGVKRILITSDYQAPYHDKALHEAMCGFIARTKPDVVVVNGDLIDFPGLSRFRPNPYTDTSVQEGLNAGFTILRDIRNAWPKAERYYLPGNHEERLQNKLLDKAPELYGIRVSGTLNQYPALSLPSLLQLEGLGFKWVVGENGEWPQAELVLSPHISVAHGWLVRKGSGMTARATLETVGHSIVTGHTHRLALIYRSNHGLDGTLETHVAMETGTMCTILGGLGYAQKPDWQNGAGLITLLPNGRFYPGLLFYTDGELLGSW